MGTGFRLANVCLACHGKPNTSRQTLRAFAWSGGLEWYKTILEVIDMRSFSNLWYWIGLAVLWSSTSHWVMGVPWDLITRARRSGGQAAEDVEVMARVNVNRLLHIARTAGLWLAGFVGFMLTTLAMLGFWYGMELAQAVFCMAFPMTFVGLVSLRTARLIEAGENTGDALYRRMFRHRMVTQSLGMVAIFGTALWGMWMNLMVGPFGS
jgi:hypothetical protein